MSLLLLMYAVMVLCLDFPVQYCREFCLFFSNEWFSIVGILATSPRENGTFSAVKCYHLLPLCLLLCYVEVNAHIWVWKESQLRFGCTHGNMEYISLLLLDISIFMFNFLTFHRLLFTWWKYCSLFNEAPCFPGSSLLYLIFIFISSEWLLRKFKWKFQIYFTPVLIHMCESSVVVKF